jgi:hypothetical protein
MIFSINEKTRLLKSAYPTVKSKPHVYARTRAPLDKDFLAERHNILVKVSTKDSKPWFEVVGSAPLDPEGQTVFREAMSQPVKNLAKFAIDVRETDFILRLTDDDGEVSEFATSVDQLDQVIDALNDLMAGEDEA